MIQHHQPHPAGTFAICSGCAREPLHIVIDGTTTREPCRTIADITSGIASQRHQLECPRCNRVTGRKPTLAECITDWGHNYTQGELPLRQPTRRKATACA